MINILIVDDNKSDRIGIHGLIDWVSLGIHVAGLAVDGMDGYRQALERKPDIILTDVAMPVLDGIKMTQKIKADLPDAKFIFMSCFDDFEYLKGAIDLDVYGYILKPIDLEELTEALDKVKQAIEFEQEKAQHDEHMRKRIQESVPILRDQLFRDMLYGKLENEHEIAERMNDLGMMHPNSRYSAMFLQIDNYDTFYADNSTENRHYLIFNVQQCVEDSMLRVMTGYVTHQHNHSLALIIVVDESRGDDSLNGIVDCANLCKETINNRLGVQVTIGISELFGNLKQLPDKFESAQYAVKSKFYSGGNRIILASEVSVPDQDYPVHFPEIKRKVDHVLESGSREQIDALLDEWYDADRRYPEAYMQSLTFSIFHIVQTTLSERNEHIGSVLGGDTNVWNKLLHFETLTEIKQWLSETIGKVAGLLNRTENGRYRKVADDIKAIIDDRYASIDNVSQIVDSLYISASHANYIFKQQTGQTIFDYLIMRRMEVAKKLLLDPRYKIYEIADQTGYKTNSYFASVFKEYAGVTPKQFRDKHML